MRREPLLTFDTFTQVGVYDWVALWVCYLVLYLVNAGANAVLAHDEAMALNVVFACFFTIQSFVTFSAFWIFRTLSYQFVMLAPGMPDTADQVSLSICCS